MDLDLFIVAVFCLIDEDFENLLEEPTKPLRSCGPKPLLDDREVLTMEITGEFLGMDTEKAIHEYFARHYPEWFPALRRRVHRTTFCRQAANLCRVKKSLWQKVLSELK